MRRLVFSYLLSRIESRFELSKIYGHKRMLRDFVSFLPGIPFDSNGVREICVTGDVVDFWI